MAFFLPSYPATIWNALKVGLAYITAVTTANDPPTPESAAIIAMDTSLKYGVIAIEADLFYQATAANYMDLAPVPTFDITIDPATHAFMEHRIDAMQAALLSINALSQAIPPQLLVQPVPNIVQTLANGDPIFPDPGFVEWLVRFNYEIPPTGLTVDNFVEQAQAAATAWVTIATAMQTQGITYNGATFDTVVQMGQAAQTVADAVSNIFPLSDATDLTAAWNTLVAAPTITRLASLVSNDPTSLASQNTSVIRYTILQLLNGFNALVVALRQTSLQQVNLATVRQGDSLMDIAARELGDYSQWYQIAQINGLVPPFIGPSVAPGITAQGAQLFIPSTTDTAPIGNAPSYTINYLGVDFYYGPLNQPMVPWAGDFQMIAGYRNLAFSLGRRLQTTLGDLIYHNDFGSRVPPEVGAIASDTEAQVLSAYTESAIRTDPRVSKILAINTQVLPNYAVSITSTVLPNGIGVLSVPVNEVIGPAVR